jgi:alkylated DNA repair dioxygenase AlkB
MARADIDDRSWDGRHIRNFDGRKDVHNLGAGDTTYLRAVMTPAQQARAFAALLDEVTFVQMFNMTKLGAVPIPRYVSAQADAVDSAHYRMPGCNQCNIPKFPWTPTVAWARDVASAATGIRGLNHCVITLYPDEDGSLAHHHDNLLDLEPGTGVVSVSFGAARPIHFHATRTTEKEVVNLQPGSLLCIGTKTNKQFTHGVPKLTSRVGPRISLTFRSIVAKTKSTTDTAVVENSLYTGEDYPFLPSHRGEWTPDMDAHSQAMESRLTAFREQARRDAAGGEDHALMLPPSSEDEDEDEDDVGSRD